MIALTPIRTRAVSPEIEAAARFLQEIGIPCELGRCTGEVLEFVDIVNGGLRIDPRCPVSNVLHEAGHLASVPKQFRHLCTGDIDGSFPLIVHLTKKSLAECMNDDPDAPLMRAILQCDDAAATAWAWAAGIHLRLPEKRIIKDSEYAGDGAFTRMALKAKCYAGINSLVHAGMCRFPRHGGYPKMLRWVQPIIDPALSPREAAYAFPETSGP